MALGDPEPEGGHPPGGLPRAPLVGRQVPAPARVTRGPALGGGLRAVGLELLAGAVAGVGGVALEQRLRGRLIQDGSLGLPVRPVGAPDIRAFIPIDPEPAEILEDGPLVLLGRTVPIGILDPKD